MELKRNSAAFHPSTQWQRQQDEADEPQEKAKENIRVQDFAYQPRYQHPPAFTAPENIPSSYNPQAQLPSNQAPHPSTDTSTQPPTPFSVFLANFCTPDCRRDLPPVFLPGSSLAPSAVLDLPSSVPREAEHTKGFRQESSRKRSASNPVTKQGELISQGMDKRLPSSFQQLEKVGLDDHVPALVTDDT